MKRSFLLSLALIPLLAVPCTVLAGSCADYAAGLPAALSTTPVGSISSLDVIGSVAFVGRVVSAPPPIGELRLYDVADPSSPSLLSTIPYDNLETGWPTDVAVVGSVAHVALTGVPVSGSGGGFSTVDVSNTSLPSKLGFVSPNTMFRSVVVSGSRAYLSDVPECCGGTVSEFDVSNAATPSLSTSFSATTNALAAKGSVLYVPSFGSLAYYDISTAGTPIFIDSIDNFDWEFDEIVIDGDHLFVSVWDTSVSSETRLVIYDVSTPATPTETGSVVVGTGGPGSLAVRDGIAYVSSAAASLNIVAVDDVSNPALYTSVTLPDAPNRMFADANALWVGDDTDLTGYPLQCTPATDAPAPNGPSALDVFAAAPYRRGGVIFVTVPASSGARLDLFDSRGRLVRSLFEGRASTTTEVRWDGSDATGRRAAPGVYFLRLSTNAVSTSERLVLIE